MSEALTREECPGEFEWSAFGASYPDTYCVDGLLWDADGGPGGEIECPMHNWAGFWEYQFGGGYFVPLCAVGEHRLPAATRIDFHDGKSLSWSAECLEHGAQRVLMRDMAELPDFDDATFVPWVPVAEPTS